MRGGVLASADDHPETADFFRRIRGLRRRHRGIRDVDSRAERLDKPVSAPAAGPCPAYFPLYWSSFPGAADLGLEIGA